MKNILGFSIGEDTKVRTAAITHKESQEPVRALVSVRFLEDGRKFTYYNDRFALQVGGPCFRQRKTGGTAWRGGDDHHQMQNQAGGL